MKQTWLIMGMPVSLVIEDETADTAAFHEVRDYFRRIDEQYSPYKPASEVSRINRGLTRAQWSREMKTVWRLCEQTKRQTTGYFDPMHEGKFDPSGLVKGWAVNNAGELLQGRGFKNFYVEAGGDIQVSGHNGDGEPWSIGIRNPFNRDEIVKVLRVSHKGVATSGTYIRGRHIYNPHGKPISDEAASLTVVGPNIYEADRFATAAFAMGQAGIGFIEALDGFEGYMITADEQATLTSGFDRYTEKVAA